MEPTKELIDEIERERFDRAERMTPGQRMLAGPRLFEWALQWTLAGIRDQFPDADEQRVEQILDERLAMDRPLDNPPR